MSMGIAQCSLYWMLLFLHGPTPSAQCHYKIHSRNPPGKCLRDDISCGSSWNLFNWFSLLSIGRNVLAPAAQQDLLRTILNILGLFRWDDITMTSLIPCVILWVVTHVTWKRATWVPKNVEFSCQVSTSYWLMLTSSFVAVQVDHELPSVFLEEREKVIWDLVLQQFYFLFHFSENCRVQAFTLWHHS